MTTFVQALHDDPFFVAGCLCILFGYGLAGLAISRWFR